LSPRALAKNSFSNPKITIAGNQNHGLRLAMEPRPPSASRPASTNRPGVLADAGGDAPYRQNVSEQHLRTLVGVLARQAARQAFNAASRGETEAGKSGATEDE